MAQDPRGWLYDCAESLPHTWAGAFYACFRALCVLIAFLAVLMVVGAVVLGLIGASH